MMDKNTLERIERVARLKYEYTSENSMFYRDILFYLENAKQSGQSKKQSWVEAFTNTFVGFAISLTAIFLILPLFGVESTPVKNIGITLCFTVISILRGYLIRRFFNKKHSK